MVRYERDVIGQMEALSMLPDYPTENTVKGDLNFFCNIVCACLVFIICKFMKTFLFSKTILPDMALYKTSL